MSQTLGQLAVRFGCELRGDPSTTVSSVATLAAAGAGQLAFLANRRYAVHLATTQASAVILDEASAAGCPVAALVCPEPYAAYARIAALLHPPPAALPGIHPSAVVDPRAQVDASASIGACSFIGPGAQIGARSLVGPGCIIEADVTVAEDVQLIARVTLCRGISIGARTVVQPGAVIGGDGFGFALERGSWVKVPQVGSVRIGSDVEIGSNTTIDRGAIEDTVLEDDVRVDNLVQIGHNVRIGAHTAIAGCAGISGSATIGARCQIGGAVGIVGHLTICDDVAITGLSMVSRSIGEPGVYGSGIPVEKVEVWRRIIGRLKRLEPQEKRLRGVERALGLRAVNQQKGDGE